METTRCRLCNEGNQEMHRIFPDSEEIDCESPIAIKIHKCISLQLPEEADDLDAQVCQGCLRQLDAFYTFRIMCRKTNSLFRRERRCKVQTNTQETVSAVGSNLDAASIPDEGCKAKSEEEPEKTGTPGADIEPDLLHDFLPEDLLSVTIEDDFNTTSSISELKESLLADLIQNDQEPACVKCSFCSVGFSNAVELKLHNECHKEQQQLRDGNYQCDHCDAKFKLYSNLLTHRRSHTGERPYACQLCGKAFSTSSNLKTHMNVHSDERPYKCGICFKSFNTENRHRLHLERHDMGEALGDSAESTRCRICGKTFSHPSYLTVHYRIHNGDRPFQCKLCSSTFTTSGNLKVHHKTHAKDKHRPYKCPFCPKTFLHASNLSVHKKTVHYEPKAQWSLRQAV